TPPVREPSTGSQGTWSGLKNSSSGFAIRALLPRTGSPGRLEPPAAEAAPCSASAPRYRSNNAAEAEAARVAGASRRHGPKGVEGSGDESRAVYSLTGDPMRDRDTVTARRPGPAPGRRRR